MYRQLVQKARNNRRSALMATRMPHINIFWDGGARDEQKYSVIAQMSDLRIRMGAQRQALICATS